MEDGHDELMGFLQSAHDHDQQGTTGHLTTEETHDTEFRGDVVLALRNLAMRVLTLERDLAQANETISKMEGR